LWVFMVALRDKLSVSLCVFDAPLHGYMIYLAYK
jgi:hypothetical protein